jgi:hypothetical protein
MNIYQNLLAIEKSLSEIDSQKLHFDTIEHLKAHFEQLSGTTNEEEGAPSASRAKDVPTKMATIVPPNDSFTVDGFLPGNERKVHFEFEMSDPQLLLSRLMELVEKNQEEKLSQYGNLFKIAQWEVIALIKLLSKSRPLKLPAALLSKKSCQQWLPADLFGRLQFYYRKVVFCNQIPKESSRYVGDQEIIAKIFQAEWLGSLPANCQPDSCAFYHYLSQNQNCEIRMTGSLSLMLVIAQGSSRYSDNEMVVFHDGEHMRSPPSSFILATYGGTWVPPKPPSSDRK